MMSLFRPATSLAVSLLIVGWAAIAQEANPTPTAAIAERLDMDGDLFFMWNLESGMNALQKDFAELKKELPAFVDSEEVGMPPYWRTLAKGIVTELGTISKQSGIAEIRGAGYSVKQVSPKGYRHKLVILRNKSQEPGKLWNAMTLPQRKMPLEFCFPKAAVLAAAHPCRVGEIWGWLNEVAATSKTKELSDWHRDAMAKAEAFGLDKAMTSLNGTVGFVVCAFPDSMIKVGDHEVPEPGVALIAQIADESMLDCARKLLPAFGLPISETMVSGKQAVTMALPAKPISLRLTLVANDGHLIVASSPKMVEAVVAAMADPKARLVEEETYKKAMEGLPGGHAVLYASPKLSIFWEKGYDRLIQRLDPGTLEMIQALAAQCPTAPYLAATGRIGKRGIDYVGHTNVVLGRELVAGITRLVIALGYSN